jgi:hypothetical protein
MQAISKGIGSSTFLAENFWHNKAFPKLFPQAGLHLRYAFFDLGSREVLVAVVDRLELAAVDRDKGPAEQIELPAKRNKLRAGRADAGPLSRWKSAMVLKSGVNRPVSHISSMLRWLSRSSLRLDWIRFR